MEKIKFLILLLFIAKLSLATGLQINPKPEPLLKDSRNNFGLSVIYSDKGYGLSGGYYKSISKSSDLFLNLSITGVSDNREFEYFDYYGNSYIQDKVNRVFMLPFNIGLQHYLFKDEIENDFKPLVNIGITPTLVLINPYDKSYFKAFGYFNAAFAFGGFAGVGMEFQQSRSLAFSMNFRYFYLPVVSGSVTSIRNSPMKDLGGIQLVFGVNFLK
jgi:hypothetical protein